MNALNTSQIILILVILIVSLFLWLVGVIGWGRWWLVTLLIRIRILVFIRLIHHIRVFFASFRRRVLILIRLMLLEMRTFIYRRQVFIRRMLFLQRGLLLQHWWILKYRLIVVIHRDSFFFLFKEIVVSIVRCTKHTLVFTLLLLLLLFLLQYQLL